MCGHILTPEILVYQKIPLRMTDRRPGDCSEVYASTEGAWLEVSNLIGNLKSLWIFGLTHFTIIVYIH